jgi:hypothetical protein
LEPTDRVAEEILPRFHALSPDARLSALVVACEPALVAWLTYALRARPAYTDSVVGLHHVVDVELPTRALDDVRRLHDAPDAAATQKAYVEPIVALQDGDWELPGQRLEHAYYAIYNLHRLAFEPQDTVTAALVLNQAISATLRGDGDEAIDERFLAWWSAWEKLT